MAFSLIPDDQTNGVVEAIPVECLDDTAKTRDPAVRQSKQVEFALSTSGPHHNVPETG